MSDNPRRDWTTCPLDDGEIATQVLAGDVNLFEVLIRRHNQAVYRTVRSVLRDESEVEEVMQEAYTRAYFRLAQYRGDASFGAWVARIAFREAIARKKRAARITPITSETDGEDASPGPLPDHWVGRQELAVALTRAVDRLPEDLRTVFTLRIVESLSTAETATCIGESEAAVKTRLHRARIHLRRYFESRFGSAAEEIYPFHLPRCDRVVAGVFRNLH